MVWNSAHVHEKHLRCQPLQSHSQIYHRGEEYVSLCLSWFTTLLRLASAYSCLQMEIELSNIITKTRTLL